MSELPSPDYDAPWTGCVHCGQTLPHEGTSWAESSRCRLFQRIAEQAWNQGVAAAHRSDLTLFAIKQVNPYRVTPPAERSDR